MKPVDLIAAALADGVELQLDEGKLIALGDSAVVEKWAAPLKANKAAIIEALQAGIDGGDDGDLDDHQLISAADAFEHDDKYGDDRRYCGDCLHLSGSVCTLAYPGGLVSAMTGYRPVLDLKRRCEGFAETIH
jgi:hypothetical protein